MPDFDVAVAGELNLDLILYGLPAELPPERELIADRMMMTLGGSSGIAAHNLSVLGARTCFFSRIGDDFMGNACMERLQEAGVDVSGVRRVSNDLKTGLTVILQREGWRNILTYLGTISQLTFEDIDINRLRSCRHLHICSLYLQDALRPRIGDLFALAKSAGLTISLDTNDDPQDRWEGLWDLLRHVDVFLPNEREARRITGCNDVELAMGRLAKIVPTVAVKLGPNGAMAQRGDEPVLLPTVPVEVVDPVGAGDSFDAGFISQYLRGADLRTCVTYGNLAGALSTTRAGGTEAFRDRDYRERFFREHLPALSRRSA
ncbi:MAG TPA: carbohydrate kinase family protein [Terriglobales bacterium]|nr:carbohydrate kinase family protein [Terriglobales bacterium]